MKKTVLGIERIIAVVGILFFLPLVYYSFRYTSVMQVGDEAILEMPDRIMSHFVVLILVLVVIVLGSLLQNKWISREQIRVTDLGEKVFLILLAAICGVITTVITMKYIMAAHAFTVGDQTVIDSLAHAAAEGNYAPIAENEYFSVYVFQIALARLLSVFYCIFGMDNVDAIRLGQAVLTGVSVWAMAGIVLELKNKRAGFSVCLCLIMSLLFAPAVFYSQFIYGESTGVCCALLSIWFYVRLMKSETKTAAGVNAIFYLMTMTICYIARSGLLIVWIAMTILSILRIMKKYEKRNVFLLIVTAAALVCMVSTQKILVRDAQIKAGIPENGGMPIVLHVAMGLQGDLDNGEMPGNYNKYNWNTYVESNMDAQLASEQGWNNISERVALFAENPSYAFRFFKTKYLNQWNEPSNGAMTSTRFMLEPEEWVDELYFGKTHDVIYEVLNQLQWIIYLGLLFSAATILASSFQKTKDDKKTEKNDCVPGEGELLILVVLIGGVCFSLLWEAKSRYIYPYMMMSIPLVSLELEKAGNMIIEAIRAAGDKKSKAET